MTYRYSDGEIVKLPEGGLKELLQRNQQYLQNYLEVEDDLDDPSYVARGNGFCDAKFSEDFIEGQIARYKARISDVRRWIQEAGINEQ